MITSSCNCGTDLTDFLLQDTDIEITLTNVIEPDVSLSHIKALVNVIESYVSLSHISAQKSD